MQSWREALHADYALAAAGQVLTLDGRLFWRRAGQGNYGYANSVCDMLCMSRRAAGLPALAIAWGPVDHVGYVAEILKVLRRRRFEPPSPPLHACTRSALPWAFLPC
jgi:hypothetical protein